ncbi:MAG: menaquinone biosynthesis protein [Bacteroidetes bacterium]|nr:menaquinone biosynthesis protein [Bacteroidota bacterium]
MKISIVNYTNTLPFRWALHNSNFIKKIDLQEDIPSICAQKLKYQQVDVALVPVALLPELNNYYIITEYCIGANKLVDSVKLYSQVPIHEVETILLDYQSKTSVTLVKVLCNELWKVKVNYKNAEVGFENNVTDKTAAVIIGDRTFGLKNKFNFEYDLATEWFNLTGLPFVFAAWVANEKLNDNFIEEFNTVLKYGVNNIDSAVNELNKNYNKDFIIDYLKNKISYNLDDGKKIGLELFLKKIKQLN